METPPKHTSNASEVPSELVTIRQWRWIERIAAGGSLADIPAKNGSLPHPRRAFAIVGKRLRSQAILDALCLHCLDAGLEPRLQEILRHIAYLQLTRGITEGSPKRLKAGEMVLGSPARGRSNRPVRGGVTPPRPTDGPAPSRAEAAFSQPQDEAGPRPAHPKPMGDSPRAIQRHSPYLSDGTKNEGRAEVKPAVNR